MLEAFFGSMYFSALRPEEAANLREQDLTLPWQLWDPNVPWWKAPDEAWGAMHVAASAPSPGQAWSNSGLRREESSPLKGREVGEVRPVPVPPPLAFMLCAHIAWFGTDGTGRLFYGWRGGQLSESTYCRVWDQTRRAVFVDSVYESPLADRPYDLRHAAVSFWITSGTPPTTVAAWAGHSLTVLNEIYATQLEGQEVIARQRITAALRGG
ncbi:hypothetical protein [Kutzneria sp. NPDC052558]|uniref:hypothetical protein n=1 Tax=Kutzneria sp. NPDC052558 TaxID=3364121 RepID=UPI0037CC92C6